MVLKCRAKEVGREAVRWLHQELSGSSASIERPPIAGGTALPGGGLWRVAPVRWGLILEVPESQLNGGG